MLPRLLVFVFWKERHLQMHIHQQLYLYIIMYSNMKWDKRLLLSDNWCRFCEHSHDATIGNLNRRQNCQNDRKFCPRCSEMSRVTSVLFLKILLEQAD